MASSFDEQRSLSPHQVFACFGGLLLAFSLARFMAASAERVGGEPATGVVAALGLQCLLILGLMIYATVDRVSRGVLFWLSTVLVVSHFLVFALAQVASAPGDEGVEGRSTAGLIFYHFAFSPLAAYWLACVLVIQRRGGFAILSGAVASVAAAGVLLILGDVTWPWRIAWAVGFAAAVVACGFGVFWLSHRQIIRNLFSDRQKHRLHEELINARRIHESLFPDAVAERGIQFGYAYRPMEQLGGDFVHFRGGDPNPSTPEGDPVFYVTLIDVTGHGISSALTVNRLNAQLDQYFAANPGACPSQVLANLNNYVLVTMARHALFATAVCVRADVRRRTLTIANAGHPPSFLFSGRALREINVEGPMLGVFPGDAFVATPQAIEVEAGDQLILVTDGALEARSSTGEFLGSEGIREMIERSCQACVASPRMGRTRDIFERKRPGRLLDRPDIRQPVGLIQQVLRRRMYDHPCALADDILLSVDDYIQHNRQDDILVATMMLTRDA